MGEEGEGRGGRRRNTPWPPRGPPWPCARSHLRRPPRSIGTARGAAAGGGGCQQRRQCRRRVGVERLATQWPQSLPPRPPPPTTTLPTAAAGAAPRPAGAAAAASRSCCRGQGPSRCISRHWWDRHCPAGLFLRVFGAATGSYRCHRTRGRAATASSAISGRHRYLLRAAARIRRRVTHYAPLPPPAPHHHRAFPVVRLPAAACCRRAAPAQGPTSVATTPGWRRYGAHHRKSPAATAGSQRHAARGRRLDRSLRRCHGRAAPADPLPPSQYETGAITTDRAARSAAESPGGRGAADALQ